ncbi:MAG: thiolase family protein [Deltaproteobacteria bacterium]|nr:thiolase family protein [Deltaproteobacteria bacterium]
MREAYVVGISTTKFGKLSDRSIKSLTAEAVEKALQDAGLKKEDIQAAWFGNGTWGVWHDQHSIRGQVALRPLGIDRIAITNVENACATGATAFHGAWTSVAAGLYEVAMAIGVEKLYYPDKAKVFWTMGLGVDMEERANLFKIMQQMGQDQAAPGQRIEEMPAADKDKSGFMDIYGGMARRYMSKYGITQRQLAVICSKNHYHGSLNPNSQYQNEISVEEVLADKLISYPITRAMCAPIGDGAAAAIICSKEFLKKIQNVRPVKILASVLGSGMAASFDDEEHCGMTLAAQKAYEAAGVGPEDINLAECHDATAMGELLITEEIGLCPRGQGGPLAESGATTLGGRLPVNVSGGLESKGHPVGATGLSQIHELVTQLRGEAGPRQVEGARIALAENGGGFLGQQEAAIAIHIFEKMS